MLIPFFVQFIYEEKNSSFLSSAAVTGFIGVLLVLTNLEENKKRLLGDYLRFGDKWRAINLTKEPYNLPEPTFNLSDNNDLVSIDKGKYISVWENKNFNLSNINIKS